MEESDWESLLHFIVAWRNEEDKVIHFLPPATLEAQMAALMISCPVVPPLKTPGITNGHTPTEQVLRALEDIAHLALKQSVQTSHPLFVNQLYGGIHPAGLAASLIIERMNTNAHTYEAAPVFVLAERLILRELRRLFFGSLDGDGIFAPGGSMSNMYAFTLARHRKCPQVKAEGLFGMPPLVFYTSEDAHYSVSKAANWMGIGVSNVVKVRTNRNGQMEPEALREAIQKSKAEGKVPLVVNATAGTTVLGAFDDLNAIADICAGEEGLWLHCDAAWGGSFIFSEKLRECYLQGIERCDSIAWNAHKMLGAPLQCSAFITRHRDSLEECNSLNAAYLFQPDKFYPVEYDRGGDKSFQCGRKADAFKLWFMWTALGPQGFKELVETTQDSARYFSELIGGREDFMLYLEAPQCTNVFFWYIPPSLRNVPRDEQWWHKLSQVQVRLKELMVLEGSMMIGYSPLPNKNVPNALRLVLPAWPPKTHAHMQTILDNIIRLGINL